MINDTAEQLYTRCEGDRTTYLDRARTCSKLSVPYIMPDDSFGATSRLETPFQGIGARGVNNLASKLLLALLPPNAPFFRLNIDEYVLAQEGAPEEAISEIETTLQRIEESVMDEVSAQSYRVGIHEALKHLIVTGNALLYMPDEGGLRVFHLDRYVIKRDPMGNIIYMATKETINYVALPKEMQDALGTYNKDIKDKCDLYTAIYRHDDKFHVFQDIKGIQMPNSGVFPLDKCPYIPLRFSKIDGEDYGRSYVEEYLGDLQSLETLTQAIVEGSAAAAKVLFLVNPNGTTRPKTLAESPNGAITQGNAQDISVLQLNKFNDFRVAQETLNTIKDRLGHAFLLSSGTVRNAERVTAEEIRMLSMELESALGGLYSLLSNELQLPMINRLLTVLNKNKRIPKVPKDVVNPVIITGVEALGRGNDLQKLDMFLAGAAQVVGAGAVAQYVNVAEYFSRRATSLGIKTAGLVKTAEELQAEQQQAMQAQQQETMMKSMGGAGVKAVSDQISNIRNNQPQEDSEV
jgi:hypothetical protein